MSGEKFDPVAHALANPGEWNIVGPTAEDDIRRAITRYGFEAVKAAVERKKPRASRGPKKKNIWPELHRLCIEAHAREWLEGGDPFADYSDYSIQKAYADAFPGHSHPGTMRTVERRLKDEPYGRKWHTLVSAEILSRESYPYAAHIRTLEALCQFGEVWEQILDGAKGYIADYTRKRGAPPADSLTMKDVEKGARNDLMSAFLSAEKEIGRLATPPRGLFGLLARYAKSTDAEC